MKKATLLYDEQLLTVAPASRAVLKLLSPRLKSLEVVKAANGRSLGKRVFYRTTKLYREIEAEGMPKGSVVQTYQGLRGLVASELEKEGTRVEVIDKRLEMPEPDFAAMRGFRFSQRELLEAALSRRESGLVGAPTRWGKCFDPETPVRMADMSVRPIKNVKPGARVMGSDGRARFVENTTKGEDKMWLVAPEGADPWICTDDHPLVVWMVENGIWTKKLIPAGEFAKLPRGVRRGARMAVARAGKARRGGKLEFSPYVVGVFLSGNPDDMSVFKVRAGRQHRMFFKVMRWASEHGHELEVEYGAGSKKKFTMRVGRPHNALDPDFLNFLRDCSYSRDALADYLAGSEEERLKLLAGFADAAGRVVKGALEIRACGSDARMNITELCRGLGFLVEDRPAHEDVVEMTHILRIAGPLNEIPVLSRRLRNAFSVDSEWTGWWPEGVAPVRFDVVPHAERAPFAGFSLKGDSQEFLLASGMVVHNTTLIVNAIRAFPGLHVTVTAPGLDLVRQLHAELKEALPGRQVKKLGGKAAPCPDVNVVSIDSLDKADVSSTRLLLCDEPHAAVTDTRLPKVQAFERALRIGFGATLGMRFDNRDILIEALFGPVLAERTYREAVAEGAICPITVFMIEMPFEPFRAFNRDAAYRSLLFRSERVARAVRWINDALLPPDWQSLYFIKNEGQAEFMQEALSGVEIPIAMAKRMTKKEREALTCAIRDAGVKRCLCSDIYVQGVTFHDIRALVNLSGGGPYTSAIQKPGRLAEIRPELGKTRGYLFDFKFAVDMDGVDEGEDWSSAPFWQVVRDSSSRESAYRDIGYDVINVRSRVELRAMLKMFEGDAFERRVECSPS